MSIMGDTLLVRRKGIIMPDLDVCVRDLPVGWHPPFRLAQGEHPVSDVAEALVKSLAAEMRRGGLPCLPRLLAIATAVAFGSITAVEGQQQLQALVRDGGFTRHLRVAEQAVNSLIAAIKGGNGITPDAEAIAQAFCDRVIESYFVAPATSELEARLGRSPEDIAALIDSLCDTAREGVAHIATALARNPDGASVRAPRTPRRDRQTPEELLGMVIG